MSVTNKHARAKKEGASCAPFFVAVSLVIIIIASVIIALVIASGLGITLAPAVAILLM